MHGNKKIEEPDTDRIEGRHAPTGNNNEKTMEDKSLVHNKLIE